MIIRAVLLIAGWIGRAFSTWLGTLRRPLAQEVAALRERNEKLRAENELLRARLRRLDPHRRPHFKPWQRLAVLYHRARYGMSLEATAKAFVVSVQTVINWTRDVESGLTHLVQAREPMNKLPDLVREIARHLKREWPRWGSRRIAGILARLGIKASRTSVQRILREGPPRNKAKAARAGRGTVRAKEARHVYVIDFTRVRSFFRSVVIGAVIDMYSRRVLAVGVCPQEPDAAFACRLLHRAVTRHGRPRWVVSDRGVQFTSTQFKALLKRHRIRRRYGAIGRPGAPTLDRWWRTFKEEFARGMMLFRPTRMIERDVHRYVRWYNVERPHTSLGYRTPEEVFSGRRVSARTPRARDTGVLEIRLLEGDSRLPILRLRRAA